MLFAMYGSSTALDRDKAKKTNKIMYKRMNDRASGQWQHSERPTF